MVNIADNFGRLGNQGFQDLVKSWNNDPSKAREYAEYHRYSPAQMADFYNRGNPAKPVTINEASGILGIDPSKAQENLGGYQDPKQYTPGTLSGWSPPQNDNIASAKAPSQISDKDFATHTNNYLQSVNNDPAGLKRYMERFNMTPEEFIDKYNRGAGTMLTYAEGRKNLGLDTDSGLVNPNPTSPPNPNTNIDPNNPYASQYNFPNLGSYDLPSFSQVTPYVPSGDALVSNRLDNILDENSLLMQRADKAGERQAHSRGLLSSSLASQYSMNAMLDKALPIAQQEAQAFVDAGMADYQGRLQQTLSRQSAEQQDYYNQRNLHMQGLISSGLSAQEAKQTMQQMEYKALIDSGLSIQEAQQALDLDYQRQEQENWRTQIKLNAENALDTDKLNSANREIVANRMSEYSRDFTNSVAEIQVNANLSEEAKITAIENQQRLYNDRMMTLASLYSVELTWDTGMFDTTGGGDGGGGGTGDSTTDSTSTTNTTGLTQDEIDDGYYVDEYGIKYAADGTPVAGPLDSAVMDYFYGGGGYEHAAMAAEALAQAQAIQDHVASIAQDQREAAAAISEAEAAAEAAAMAEAAAQEAAAEAKEAADNAERGV